MPSPTGSQSTHQVINTQDENPHYTPQTFNAANSEEYIPLETAIENMLKEHDKKDCESVPTPVAPPIFAMKLRCPDYLLRAAPSTVTPHQPSPSANGHSPSQPTTDLKPSIQTKSPSSLLVPPRAPIRPQSLEASVNIQLSTLNPKRGGSEAHTDLLDSFADMPSLSNISSSTTQSDSDASTTLGLNDLLNQLTKEDSSIVTPKPQTIKKQKQDSDDDEVLLSEALEGMSSAVSPITAIDSKASFEDLSGCNARQTHSSPPVIAPTQPLSGLVTSAKNFLSQQLSSEPEIEQGLRTAVTTLRQIKETTTSELKSFATKSQVFISRFF